MVSGPGLAQPEVADLARCDQVLDRPRHVLDRHVGIDAVLVEHIDMVHAEKAQAVVENLADMLGSAVIAVVARPAELGGDHHVVPHGCQGLSDDTFIVTPAIHLGGVEERHADLMGVTDRLDGVVRGVRSVMLGDAHCPVADG